MGHYIVKIVDCVETNCEYGALSVPNNMSIADVQNAIYKIKDSYGDSIDWYVEDILNKLIEEYPNICEVNFIENDYLTI